MTYDTSEILLFAAATSPVIALLLFVGRKLLQILLGYLVDLFFEKKTVQDAFTSNVILRYLEKRGKYWNLRDEHFNATVANIRSVDKERTIAFKDLSESDTLFFYKFRPVMYVHERDTSLGVSERRNFRFLRWSLNWDEVVKEAAKHNDEIRDGLVEGKKFQIIRHEGARLVKGVGDPPSEPDDTYDHNRQVPLNYDLSDIGPPTPLDAMEQLSISDAMRDVIKSVRFWLTHKQWYRERDIDWRMGVLLHGKPGSGKTSLCRAIAEHFDIPIHVFDLSSMDNHDFLAAWESTKQDTPRIVLLEDIDAIFHGRKNVVKTSNLTFDTLLNAIAGIERETGLLLFGTTNRIEHIDPALGIPDAEGGSTRPGRFDFVIELPPLDHAGRLKMALRIVGDPVVAEKMATKHTKDTPATFQHRCCEYAKAQLWADVE